MTEPGSGAHPYGGQPGAPDAVSAPAAPKKGLRKWLPIGGSVVAAGIIAASALGFGFGDPEVGDCVTLTGDTSFDVVDCGADEAEYRIVGVEKEELTQVDLQSKIDDDSVCADFPNWEVALWNGDMETEPGAVYCTEAA